MKKLAKLPITAASDAPLLSTSHAAEHLALSVRTLIRRRGEGTGPGYIDLNNSEDEDTPRRKPMIRYPLDELDRWRQSRRRGGEERV